MESDADAGGGLASAVPVLFPLAPAAVVSACAALKAYCLLTAGRCRCTRRMDGKTVIITGANSGVGKETARELCKRGARVILACRDVDKARLAASDIARNTGVQPVCMQLDLCSFESVRQFAQQVLEREERLDVLINNAGKIATAKKTETEDGFESTLQTNHLGHFLLSNLLLDLLKKSAPSRVIVVGSSMIWWARMDRNNIDFSRYYDRVGVYNTTKLYNMLFVVALSRRLNGTVS
ncbi:hypothetical protein V5799_015590 [Amblyomma americanum]|uniref:Dehydrogenase with different specificities related to short-chain alcohol dehydrogenase n=1 Tax=Amblyomma americanum TaxID=6943 RepID=A0AAQ4F8W0_AMBAM